MDLGKDEQGLNSTGELLQDLYYEIFLGEDEEES